MIEFFEFLNSCSPTRTIVYIIFIIVFSFIVLVGVSNIMQIIVDRKNDQDIDETKAQD